MIGLDALERFLAPIAKLASCLLARNRPARIAAATAEAAPAAPVIPQSVVEAVNEVLFPPAREPQVAGFEMRIVPAESRKPVAQDFRLAARLASVAHLNTRAGRVPRKAQQASDAKPVPVALAGAKKQRTADAGRCLIARKKTRPSAKIIPFPQRGRFATKGPLRAAA